MTARASRASRGGTPVTPRAGRRGWAATTATTALAVVAVTAATAGCDPRPADGASATTPGVATSDDARPAARRSTPPAVPSSPPSAPVSSPAATPPSPSVSASVPASAPPKPDPQGTTLLASGSQGRQVRELQARLRQIGHFNRSPTGYYGTVTADAVRSFQTKRGLTATGRTDTLTWQRLVGMTRPPTAAELDPPTTAPVAKPDKRCMTGRVLCISKNSRTLSWMIDGRVVSSMDVRFGSQYTPTREGTFSVYWKSRHHVSTIYHTAMPYAMFFSGGQAVHYSPDFAARGYQGASHGCVNVRDEGKIAALFDQVKTGDKVVVHG